MKFFARVALRALHSLRRDLFASLASIALLSLGIAAFTAGFTTLVDSLWGATAFTDAPGLVRLWGSALQDHSRKGLSGPLYSALSRELRSLEEMALFASHSLMVRRGDTEESVSSASVSSSVFSVLEVSATEGRLLLPEDDRHGAEPVCLVNRSLWSALFPAEGFVLGRYVLVDGRQRLVVGVLPDGFDFPHHTTQVWLPIRTGPWSHGLNGGASFGALGRLRADGTLSELNQELSFLLHALRAEQEFDDSAETVWAEPLDEAILEAARPRLKVLTIAVVLVLISATLNLGLLQLARSARERTQYAIRAALGAKTRHLAASLLGEAVLLTGIGTLVAVPLAHAFITVLFSGPRQSLAPIAPPELRSVGFAAAAFFALVSVAIASAPLLRPPRDVLAALKGSPGTVRLGPWRRLAALELALAVVFGIGAWSLAIRYHSLLGTSSGLEPKNVLVTYVRLPQERYPLDLTDKATWQRNHTLIAGMLADIREIPGVREAAVGTVHPLDPGWEGKYSVTGESHPGGPRPTIRTRWVSSGYFQTTGIPLLTGRMFDSGDHLDSVPVAILSEGAARRLFPGKAVLGKWIRIWDDVDRQIVGVVGDTRFLGLERPLEPAIYASYFQMPSGFFNLTLRTTLKPPTVWSLVKEAIESYDPLLALSEIESLERLLGEPLTRARAGVLLSSLNAIVILALSTMGLFSMMTVATTVWRRELAVRSALGASRPGLLILGLYRGMPPVLGGTIAGCGLALGVEGSLRVLSTLALEVPASSYLIAGTGSAFLAVLAVLLPALRATRFDPVEVLRKD